MVLGRARTHRHTRPNLATAIHRSPPPGWPILSALIMTRFFACGGEGLAHSYRTTAEIRVADYKPR
mgnify:CR=1 FL=1